MASLDVTLTHICAGGGHLQVSASVNGGAARTINIDTDRVMSAVSDEDVETFLAILLKIHAIGKTRLQVRNNLTAGLGITI